MSSWYRKDEPERGDYATHPIYGSVCIKGFIPVEESSGDEYGLVEDDDGKLHIVCLDDLTDIGYYGD